MKKVLLYIHGKGGSAREAERYRPLCPEYRVVGVDYQGELPWEVRGQLRAAYDQARRQSEPVIVLANSIGAYFAMDALRGCPLAKALFISPVLDMERLILEMMGWAGVSEAELRERGEIPTADGGRFCPQPPRPPHRDGKRRALVPHRGTARLSGRVDQRSFAIT